MLYAKLDVHLLEADVNLRVVKSFISSIKDKAEGENVLQGVNPSQQLS